MKMKADKRLPKSRYAMPNRKSVTFRFPPNLLEDLAAVAKQLKTDKTNIAELALQDFFEKVGILKKQKK